MAWTTPQTWPSVTNLTSTEFNTHIRDNLLALTTYEDYTPTLSSWGLGNGTLTGKKIVANELGKFQITFTVGSTSTFSGTPSFSLPATSSEGVFFPVGSCSLIDASSSNRRYFHTILLDSDTCGPRGEDNVALNSTTPWTWATGDQIILSGEFPVAV